MTLRFLTFGIALLATTAHASSIDTGHCDTSIPIGESHSGPCSIVQVSAAGGDPDLAWMRLSGSTHDDVFGISPAFVRVSTQGTASGTIDGGTVIPVSWDFFLSDPDGVEAHWSVFFNFELFHDNTTFEVDGTTHSSMEVKGTGSLVVAATDSLFLWSMGVSANSFGGPLALDVPAATGLEFNTATPEPGSALLTAGVLAVVLLRARGWRN
jgi:hypothetical protein